MKLSLRLGRLRLTFSFWFFAVVACFALLDYRILLLYMALPVLIHESGHLLVLLLLGGAVEEIYFTPVSIAIRTRRAARLSYGRELAVSAAGIAANLLAAFLLWRFAFQSMRTMLMVASNLAVAFFNLLPIGSLDGGQIVRSLCDGLFSPAVARLISVVVSFVVLVPLTAFTVLLFLRGEGNFTLALLCAYLLVTLILQG